MKIHDMTIALRCYRTWWLLTVFTVFSSGKRNLYIPYYIFSKGVPILTIFLQKWSLVHLQLCWWKCEDWAVQPTCRICAMQPYLYSAWPITYVCCIIYTNSRRANCQVNMQYWVLSAGISSRYAMQLILCTNWLRTDKSSVRCSNTQHFCSQTVIIIRPTWSLLKKRLRSFSGWCMRDVCVCVCVWCRVLFPY